MKCPPWAIGFERLVPSLVLSRKVVDASGCRTWLAEMVSVGWSCGLYSHTVPSTFLVPFYPDVRKQPWASAVTAKGHAHGCAFPPWWTVPLNCEPNPSSLSFSCFLSGNQPWQRENYHSLTLGDKMYFILIHIISLTNGLWPFSWFYYPLRI